MSKTKKKSGFGWWCDWAILWIFGGFTVAYFIYIPITGDKVHPLHWLFGFVGGVVGYGIGLFLDTGLPRIVRVVRRGSRRTDVKRDGGRREKRRG